MDFITTSLNSLCDLASTSIENSSSSNETQKNLIENISAAIIQYTVEANQHDANENKDNNPDDNQQLIHSIYEAIETRIASSSSFHARLVMFQLLDNIIRKTVKHSSYAQFKLNIVDLLDPRIYQIVCGLLPRSNADLVQYNLKQIQFIRQICNNWAKKNFFKGYMISNAVRYVESAIEQFNTLQHEQSNPASNNNSSSSLAAENSAKSKEKKRRRENSEDNHHPHHSVEEKEASKAIENLRTSQKRKNLEANLRPQNETLEEQILSLWKETLNNNVYLTEQEQWRWWSEDRQCRWRPRILHLNYDFDSNPAASPISDVASPKSPRKSNNNTNFTPEAYPLALNYGLKAREQQQQQNQPNNGGSHPPNNPAELYKYQANDTLAPAHHTAPPAAFYPPHTQQQNFYYPPKNMPAQYPPSSAYPPPHLNYPAQAPRHQPNNAPPHSYRGPPPHLPPHLPPSEYSSSNRDMCRDWDRGYCARGAECKFSHNPLPAAAAAYPRDGAIPKFSGRNRSDNLRR
jgi:hypothetical protein